MLVLIINLFAALMFRYCWVFALTLFAMSFVFVFFSSSFFSDLLIFFATLSSFSLISLYLKDK